MPLYSDHISNMYYGASPSYSSLPYGYNSSVSSIGPSYSASYLNPGGSYSGHSSLGGYSRTPLTSRWISGVGRNYSPILSTISERGSASPVRINSPRRIPITTRSYGTSSYTIRPININTADIDVSKDRYRHRTEIAHAVTTPRRESPKTESENENGPFMPRVDGKPETGIDSLPGSTDRGTIKRGRTVVRLYTIKRKERDSPRKPQEDIQTTKTTNDKACVEIPTEETNSDKKGKKWREKLSEDLAYKDKKEKKSLGTKLMEKFTVKEDNDKDSEIPAKEAIIEPELPQSLPTVSLQNISFPANTSLDRRCSMELLAEQAHLLDSLIRNENLSTVSLDLSKVGVVDEHINNTEIFSLLKRRRSNDLHNPLKTTKSDHSLHDNLKSHKDVRDPKKRRSIKKSASGGSICRLDSITEFPKEPINVELPAIEESRLSIKQETTKQKSKPKLKTKFTSSVEVSAPMSPLKFRVENVVVENVVVKEKPRAPRKGITYSSEVEIISNPVTEKEVSEETQPKKVNTSNDITATTVDLESPEPADGNFWDKIGKRETVYLMKRKQNLDEAKEKHKRALFWFPEEEESGHNDESDLSTVVKLSEADPTKSEVNVVSDALNAAQKDEKGNIKTSTQRVEIMSKLSETPSSKDVKLETNKARALSDETPLKLPNGGKQKVLENSDINQDINVQIIGKKNQDLKSLNHVVLNKEKDKSPTTSKRGKSYTKVIENSKADKIKTESLTEQANIVENESKVEPNITINKTNIPPEIKSLKHVNDNETKVIEDTIVTKVDIQPPPQVEQSVALSNASINEEVNRAHAVSNVKVLNNQDSENTNVCERKSDMKQKSLKNQIGIDSTVKGSELKMKHHKAGEVTQPLSNETLSTTSGSSLADKTCNVRTGSFEKENRIGKSASSETISENKVQVSREKKTKSENLKKIRKKEINSDKSDKKPLKIPLPKLDNKDKSTNVATSDNIQNKKVLPSSSKPTSLIKEISQKDDIREQTAPEPKQLINDCEKPHNKNSNSLHVKRDSVRKVDEIPATNKTDNIKLLKNNDNMLTSENPNDFKSQIDLPLVEPLIDKQNLTSDRENELESSSQNETKVLKVPELPHVVKSQDIPIKESATETGLAVQVDQKTGEEKKAENNSKKDEQPENPNQVAAPQTFTPKKPVKEQKAVKTLIATPRPLQKRVPQIIHSSDSESSSEEESSEEDDESESSEDSTEFFECENNGDGRTSTGSNDSGFDSSAPTSPATFLQIKKDCDVNCHRKCEKLTANLCGVNQRLLVEALASRTASKKGGDNAGASSSKVSAQCNNTDILEQELEQSHAYDLFRKTGRFTPPARSIPRFRKYTIEDFQFIKVLGKGSFGKVLLAELRDTEYYYAVKCLKKDVVLEDDDVECTLIERKVLALGTNHPYLCHLFATFQTDSHLFFVMEYLNGGDLMFHIQQSGRFPEARARFYAAEIVSGLKFLHKRGIVYRDLKLDNILLDFEGHVRIADFGMCKLQIYLEKTADTFCGTPDYMAPEIIKGLKYNQTVDWWSFGVLLYEMLIGQSPFSGCDEDELFWSICNEMPSYPRFLSTEALTILTRLLDKDARTRLGGTECMHGDIREQPFFHPIHWDRLERRDLEAPFRPRVRHPMDTQYFDRAFTGERPRLTAVEPHVLRSMDQEPFRGFSYTNPNTTDR